MQLFHANNCTQNCRFLVSFIAFPFRRSSIILYHLYFVSLFYACFVAFIISICIFLLFIFVVIAHFDFLNFSFCFYSFFAYNVYSTCPLPTLVSSSWVLTLYYLIYWLLSLCLCLLANLLCIFRFFFVKLPIQRCSSSFASVSVVCAACLTLPAVYFSFTVYLLLFFFL